MDVLHTLELAAPNAPPGEPDDRDLVAALLEDRDHGFEEMVRRYQRDVYSVAARICGRGRAADAEDLAAEAFLRAYRALLGYERQRIEALRARPWLLTILLNTWRNSLRTAARRVEQVPLASVLPSGTESEPSARASSRGSSSRGSPSGGSAEPVGPDTAELAERNETSRELADLVARLPERQRLAVVLRHVVGLPVTEVSEVLGLPENTVKSHTARGLAALRTLWAQTGPGKETR